MARVLIIDDEMVIRNSLRQLLETAGHDVADASNGHIGMQMHAQTPFDLVVTDILMPEQEGLETIMEIRRTSPGVKIIAMSGGGRFIHAEVLDIAQKLGAQRILTKPFTSQHVLDMVAELLKVGGS